MQSHSGKLAGLQPGSGEHKRERISADHAVGRAFHVGIIKREIAKLADVLVCEELLEAQPGESDHARGTLHATHAAGRQPGRSVEGNLAAGELQREARIHGDRDRHLIRARVADEHCTDASTQSQIVRRQTKTHRIGVRDRHAHQ